MNCQFCGHPETDHRPPLTHSDHKFGDKTNGKHGPHPRGENVVTARTCCWSNPMCCCVKFIKPKTFYGQTETV